MFVPRTQLFFNFLGNLFCTRSRIAILPLLFILPIYVTAVRENRCMVGGKYLFVNSKNQTITQPVQPNMAVMQGVGKKKCGFQVLGKTGGDCMDDRQVDYIAADVSSSGYFCSFWNERIVCVCPDYGCNSVEGMFYEILLRALTEQGSFKGYYSQEPDIIEDEETKKLAVTECLLQNIEKLHKTSVNRINAAELKKKTNMLETLRSTYKELFPKPERLEKLKDEEKNGPPTTTTTTTPEPTTPELSGQASALISKKGFGDNKQEEESWGVMPLVITVVLFVVVLSLVAAMIVAFICFRRKVNDNLTTIRSVASDTSLHGSVMFSPNPNAPPPGAAANSDYFANPNLNSAPVAPVAPNGTAAPSTTSKSSARAGTSPVNTSLMATPNPNVPRK